MNDYSMLKTALQEADTLRASLIKRAKGPSEAIAIASVFAGEAERIYRELGGGKLAASQFMLWLTGWQ